MSFHNRSLTYNYSDFRFGIESAPQGTFEGARMIYDTLSEMMDGMEEPAHNAGLSTSKSDRAFEIEAMMFDMLYHENPVYQGEIMQVTSLGNQLAHADNETRDRIIGGLRRDRDFIREMKAREAEDATMIDSAGEPHLNDNDGDYRA